MGLGGEIWENLREVGGRELVPDFQNYHSSPTFSTQLSSLVRSILAGLGCDVPPRLWIERLCVALKIFSDSIIKAVRLKC